jgi:hypothetical protein
MVSHVDGQFLNTCGRKIAWLLSHKTLRSAEVPILCSLGFEIWTQKQVPGVGSSNFNNGWRSGDVDLSWDRTSTLPPEVLQALNQFNFYDEAITPEIGRYLNTYFELIVTDCFPNKIAEILRQYRGKVMLRACGREHPNAYTPLLWWGGDKGTLSAVREAYSRVWFAAGYPQVVANEIPFMKQRSVVLPVGLPSETLAKHGCWRGGDRRILFVCPSIAASTYYREIYEQFKTRFGSLPHVVAGYQTTPIEDPSVVGYLPHEEFSQLFETAQVMYYHSREPRHIHYHPLEAIAYGMPVVYLTGGLLDYFDQGNRAGACETEAEAFDKLNRVLSRDEVLIGEIRSGQQNILAPFRPEPIREAWRSWFASFEPIVDGLVPADTRWPNRPPVPGEEELAEFPALLPQSPYSVSKPEASSVSGEPPMRASPSLIRRLARRVKKVANRFIP